MADEITVSIGFTVSKGGAIAQRAVSDQFDMAGSHIASGTQAVGTSAENIEKGDISTAGWLYVKNLDGTNFVQIGYDDSGTFYPTVKVKAGEFAVFRLGQDVPQAKADTGACNIEYIMVED